MKLSIRQIAFCAVIAAVYAALTVAEAGFGSGQVQVRVAEALCVLPFLMPISMWGLFAGCIIANLVSGAGMSVSYTHLDVYKRQLYTAP